MQPDTPELGRGCTQGVGRFSDESSTVNAAALSGESCCETTDHCRAPRSTQMAGAFKTGTILIKDGTLLPDALQIESEPCATGWRIVKNIDASGLGRKIHEAGWSFFCVAGEVKGTIFGFGGRRNARRVVKRILANLKSEKFN